MIRRVLFTPDADSDFARLEAFLFEKSPDAAVRAAASIAAAARSLKRSPHRGRPVGGDGRRELVHRFGRSTYLLRYLVLDDDVLILRIFHSREER